MRPTVIVPFHRNLAQLQASVSSIRSSLPNAEIVIAADGARDDCGPVARAYDARVVIVPGPSGPAVARNRAAAMASGDLLIFVDADVVVSSDALPRICQILAKTPELSGIFGAYDREPAEPGFMSQFKNLSHTYVHEIGNPEAATFWAGLGAVRTAAFRAVGGYDERFARPSVEDIDLGYRLTAAGYRLRLDPSIRGKHLKRWTLWSCIVTDIRARGIPWTQLIHRYKALSNDLNTSVSLRMSVVASYLVLGALIAGVFTVWAWPLVALALGALWILNVRYYRWFVEQRGWWFAVRVVGVHLIHHLCNGISFVAGSVLHAMNSRGIRLPGALPRGVWTRDASAAPGPGRLS